ncbi:MAG: peptide-methionine (S)-S-oxide reductase [Dehalococcoidales bacterium]|nr:peptide-methionine (S)-S-oxide reductase [Dehalococcoidales bacterium]
MVSTVVGYAGGTTANPTYYKLGDHSETIQIEYDPSVISYAELLDVFWQQHNPVYPSGSRQYMSNIFYHDEAQKQLALEKRSSLEAATGHRIYTDIVPAADFYPAEEYHQKYYLEHVRDIYDEYRAIYPDINDFVKSSAVTRVNGYAAGYGTEEAFREELGSLGLSEKSQAKLADVAEKGLTPVCPVPQIAD